LPDTVEKIMADINGLIEDAYRNTLPLKSGAAELLEVLRQANLPMVIATATDRYLVEAALQRNGVLEYFQDIFTCGMVGAGKDQPLIYEMACAALQTKKRETWVFEDALHAIVTAKQAGFPVVAVYDPAFHADQQAIGRLADIHLSSLDEWRLPSNV
jgi:thiamine-phosphate pyrophosphorylase